ncbi:uncharacterized protein [Nicotiana tomentosiformis]|uniref:uncharacterized protein n=1 Tax=Nicotiana tomentosiformis TaxID=4098 RepID=UPI00051C37DE|nr:uncharacterized protein LOC104109684 [Nicotiana tomentosiformis]
MSKWAMIWYHNLPPNSIDSFTMLTDAFVKAHVRSIKVKIRISDLFKVKQRDNEMLREFVSRFQMEWMDLPPVADDWAIQEFTQGLNPQSSLASQQLKQNLVEYPEVTWADVHNRYQSKIKVKDDQLGAHSGSVYPIKTNDRPKRVVDHESRPVRDRYQPYNADRRGNGSGHNTTRNKKRGDRRPKSRGLMSKNGFDRPLGGREAPRLSEYNFNVDATDIVSAIGHIKETKWPRPLQSDPTKRDPNLMCKYLGTHCHRNGHLREFLSDRAKNHFRNRDYNKQTEQEEPQHVINMIIGVVPPGTDDKAH